MRAADSEASYSTLCTRALKQIYEECEAKETPIKLRVCFGAPPTVADEDKDSEQIVFDITFVDDKAAAISAADPEAAIEKIKIALGITAGVFGPRFQSSNRTLQL